MAIDVTRTKKEFIMDDSAAVSEAITVERFIVMAPGGAGTGSMTVGLPAGAGVNHYGVLQNLITTDSLAIGDLAKLSIYGITEIRIMEAILPGVEVSIGAATGRIGNAAATHYVVGDAREGGIGVGTCISVTLRKYQKNA